MDKFTEELDKLNLPPIEGGGYRIPDSAFDQFSEFITCFCEDGDLLSQWRAYGSDQGYSLGFDTELLERQDIDTLSPVQYGISTPHVFFENELEYATQPTAHPGVEAYYSALSLIPRIALVKNPSFSEEKEWRLLKTLEFYVQSDYKINFRPSPMGAIGFISIPYKKECLREIIIGPGPYSESCLSAVQTMLTCNDFMETTCQVSKIPYRR
jgi:hypothetical protein